MEKLLATEGYFSLQTKKKLLSPVSAPRSTRVVSPGPSMLIRTTDIDVSSPPPQRSLLQAHETRTEWIMQRGEPFRQIEWSEVE